MRLWDSNALAKDFAEERVPRWNVFVYLATLISFFALIYAKSRSYNYTHEGDGYFTNIQAVFGLIIGGFFCFLKNCKVDRKNFFSRFIAFIAINFVRYLLCMTVILIMAFVLMKVFNPQQYFPNLLLNIFVTLSPLVFLFWQVGRGIEKIKLYRMAKFEQNISTTT